MSHYHKRLVNFSLIENPFESGHIKNYILLYASVVLIMVLFFLASSLFHDVKDIEKKVFHIEIKEELPSSKATLKEDEPQSQENTKHSPFKLLKSGY